MTKTFCLSYKRLVLKSQMELLQEFFKTREWNCDLICDLARMMLATPPNSAWGEHAYSKMEQLYQKGCNQIDINHLKNQFFLWFFNFSIKERKDY